MCPTNLPLPLLLFLLSLAAAAPSDASPCTSSCTADQFCDQRKLYSPQVLTIERQMPCNRHSRGTLASLHIHTISSEKFSFHTVNGMEGDPTGTYHEASLNSTDCFDLQVSRARERSEHAPA
jgi:hypothetical protein